MFSQYSWWDFIKFVLILAVPYYAFVLFKYYREDIREWLSNRGQPSPEPAYQQSDDEEEPRPSIFTVKDYSKTGDPQVTPFPQPQPADWLPAPSAVAGSDTKQQARPMSELPHEEVELQGPAVETGPDVVFGLPIPIPTDNAGEHSVDEIIAAANRLTTDEEGVLTPMDADDQPAAKIASVINNQQGRAAFGDFNFKR